ncbi:MAG: hypothetical protein OXG26_16795 [Caldilineaceae bacterium]|nr:hypothetical protein [Caldilineaceae bacterium]
MSWDMASEWRKLNQWEERIRQEVGEGDLLLGELGYTEEDLEEIGGLLHRTIFYRLRQGATIYTKLQQVSTSCPLTFALYLVLEGVHHYGDAGLYWHGPKERLKIENNHTAPCGVCFREVLAEHNLPVFEQSRGFRYVTPILLHGGIPNAFLKEFFDFLYRHEIQPHRIAIDAQTLVARWRQQADDLTTLSKPVSRFLRHGGLVAEDFVARCLEMFRAAAESDIGEFGLPERVQNAYREWQEQQGDEFHARPLRTRIRPPQRPILTVAPYTIGVGLELPPQQMPSRDAPHEMKWRIIAGNHTQTIDTTRQRIENGYRYDATTELQPIPPAEEYVVRLFADEQLLREWILAGVGAIPLLLFDPFDDYEADALEEQEWHKQGERWLLYPAAASLQVNGASQCIRQLPQMTGNWQDYRLEVWKLAPGTLTLLDDSGKPVHQLPVVQEKIRRRPYLTNGKQPLAGLSHSDYPLFSGRPPTLVIHTTQPQRWQISLRGEGNALQGEYHSFRLSDLPFRRHEREDSIHLDLSADKLLGSNPIGRFEVTVRGPLGHNYTLGLRMIPQIAIEGHDRVYLSPPDEPACIRIITDAATTIHLSPPRAGIELRRHWLSENRHRYSLTMEAHIQQLSLQLSHQTGVKVAFSIPIQRLRWLLYTGLPTDGGPQWQIRPSSIFPDGLAANAELRVTLPLLVRGPAIHVGWRLLDVDGQVVRAVPPDRKTLQRLVTVPLTEVLGLWREKQESLCWQWEILVDGQSEAVLVDVLYLLPDLGKVQYAWQEDAGQVQLKVYWENPHPGHKQLQLWPLDRPWVEEPITRSVPHKEELTLIEWQLPQNDLPSEIYLGKIVTFNPWASQRPQRPTPEQQHTVLIKPSGLSEHYAEIIQLRDQGKANAEQLLSLSAHQRHTGQGSELHKTNQAVMQLRETLSLTWLVRWAETTRKLDSTAYRLTQLRMFDERVIDRLAQGEHSDDELERYFQHLRVDKPLEKLHLWVLQSELRAVPRKRCLELLLTLPLGKTTFSTVMAALLEDVNDASVLLSEAVNLLRINSQAAAKYLALQDGPDAAEMLHELASQAQLDVKWIWPKMTLDTSIGSIVVHSLRDRTTGQTRYCTPLSGSCYADGILQLSPSALSVRLDLRHRLLHFNTHNPYQCQHCHQLFSDMSGYTQHHESKHIGQPRARRRLKQDQELAWIRPLLNDDREEERL